MRHNGDSRRPEDIQAEIARTRGDMDATLTAIEQRLTPGQLVDQGLDYLRHSGAREFAANLGGSVKNNPLPIALMGVSIAWLMATGNRRPSYLEERSEGTSSVSTTSVKEGMSSAKDRMSQTAQSARERVGQMGQSARGQMERARQQAERMRSGYDAMVREQPLALGAIGLAIGALLAAAAPRTRQEDELMGEASDRLTEKAKEIGKEQAGKVQQVAQAAKDAAAGEAKKQGMAPQQGSQGSQSAQPKPAQGAPSGRPNVIEPARATPMEGAKPRDPRLGTP